MADVTYDYDYISIDTTVWTPIQEPTHRWILISAGGVPLEIMFLDPSIVPTNEFRRQYVIGGIVNNIISPTSKQVWCRCVNANEVGLLMVRDADLPNVDEITMIRGSITDLNRQVVDLSVRVTNNTLAVQANDLRLDIHEYTLSSIQFSMANLITEYAKMNLRIADSAIKIKRYVGNRIAYVEAEQRTYEQVLLSMQNILTQTVANHMERHTDITLDMYHLRNDVSGYKIATSRKLSEHEETILSLQGVLANTIANYIQKFTRVSLNQLDTRDAVDRVQVKLEQELSQQLETILSLQGVLAGAIANQITHHSGLTLKQIALQNTLHTYTTQYDKKIQEIQDVQLSTQDVLAKNIALNASLDTKQTISNIALNNRLHTHIVRSDKQLTEHEQVIGSTQKILMDSIVDQIDFNTKTILKLNKLRFNLPDRAYDTLPLLLPEYIKKSELTRLTNDFNAQFQEALDDLSVLYSNLQASLPDFVQRTEITGIAEDLEEGVVEATSATLSDVSAKATEVNTIYNQMTSLLPEIMTRPEVNTAIEAIRTETTERISDLDDIITSLQVEVDQVVMSSLLVHTHKVVNVLQSVTTQVHYKNLIDADPYTVSLLRDDILYMTYHYFDKIDTELDILTEVKTNLLSYFNSKPQLVPMIEAMYYMCTDLLNLPKDKPGITSVYTDLILGTIDDVASGLTEQSRYPTNQTLPNP